MVMCFDLVLYIIVYKNFRFFESSFFFLQIFKEAIFNSIFDKANLKALLYYKACHENFYDLPITLKKIYI